MMKQLLLVITILLATNAFAVDQLLLTITNEDNDKIAKLALRLDKKNDIANIIDQTYLNGELVSDFLYPLSKLDEGIVMHESKGRDIVTMRSTNASAHNGGHVLVTYLYNGITGKYNYMEINIMRDGDDWGVYFEGRKINKLHLRIHKSRVFGTIGIKEITVSND